MSYINHVLQPGETVRYQGSTHWMLYFPAILLVATGLIILIMTWGAVTDRRVIYVRGFFARKSIEVHEPN